MIDASSTFSRSVRFGLAGWLAGWRLGQKSRVDSSVSMINASSTFVQVPKNRELEEVSMISASSTFEELADLPVSMINASSKFSHSGQLLSDLS